MILTSPRYPVLGVNKAIRKVFDFIEKADMIHEFLDTVNLLRKSEEHSYLCFLMSQSQLVLYLDPIGIKFEILNQIASYTEITSSWLLRRKDLSGRWATNPWFWRHSWVFGVLLLSESQILRNLLSYNFQNLINCEVLD